MDEIQAKVLFVHDEERILSEEEAVVSICVPNIVFGINVSACIHFVDGIVSSNE